MRFGRPAGSDEFGVGIMSILPGVAETPESIMADLMDIVEEMKSRYDIRIRRWRSSMSGKAWRVYYHDGRAVNWIESPRPKRPSAWPFSCTRWGIMSSDSRNIGGDAKRNFMSGCGR